MNNNSPEIQRFIYFICKAARSMMPSDTIRNPRAMFNFYIYASNKLNEVFKFNMSKNDILEQVYAYNQYGSLCKNYYENNEWPLEFKGIEYELDSTEIDYEADATIQNYNNLEYCSMPDSSDFHYEIKEDISSYEMNAVNISGDVDGEVLVSSIASGVVLPEDDFLVNFANDMCDMEDSTEDKDEFTEPYNLEKMCKEYFIKTILVSHDSLDAFARYFEEKHIKIVNSLYAEEQHEFTAKKEQEALNEES